MAEKRIFYIDDDADDINFFEDVARQLGHDAVCFLDTNKFFTELDRAAPDLVLVDLNMPQMSGFDVIRKIRRNSTINQVPVVIHSTAGDQKSILAGKEAGADMYIRKPDSVAGLKEVIHFITSMDFERLRAGSQRFFMQVCDSQSRRDQAP